MENNNASVQSTETTEIINKLFDNILVQNLTALGSLNKYDKLNVNEEIITVDYYSLMQALIRYWNGNNRNTTVTKLENIYDSLAKSLSTYNIKHLTALKRIETPASIPNATLSPEQMPSTIQNKSDSSNENSDDETNMQLPTKYPFIKGNRNERRHAIRKYKKYVKCKLDYLIDPNTPITDIDPYLNSIKVAANINAYPEWLYNDVVSNNYIDLLNNAINGLKNLRDTYETDPDTANKINDIITKFQAIL